MKFNKIKLGSTSFCLVQTNERLGEGSECVTARGYLFRKSIRRVAIKVKSVSRNSHELQVLASLKKHTNIVNFLGGFRSNSFETIVLEELSPMTAADCILTADRRDRMNLILYVAVPMINALYHIHQHDLIHRDFKPANILMTWQGIPKLTDFGMSKTTQLPHYSCGTPSLLAPENYTGRSYTKLSEAFSFALSFSVLFEGFFHWSKPHFKQYDFETCRAIFNTTSSTSSETKSLLTKVFLTSEAIDKEGKRCNIKENVISALKFLTVFSTGKTLERERTSIEDLNSSEKYQFLLKAWKKKYFFQFKESRTSIRKSLSKRRKKVLSFPFSL